MKQILKALLVAIIFPAFIANAYGGERGVNGIESSYSPPRREYNYSVSFSSERHRGHHHRPRIIKEKYRTYHKRGKTCQETITIIKKHGKRKRVVSTECWRNRGYHHSPSYSSHRGKKWGDDNRNHGHHRDFDRYYR